MQKNKHSKASRSCGAECRPELIQEPIPRVAYDSVVDCDKRLRGVVLALGGGFAGVRSGRRRTR